MDSSKNKVDDRTSFSKSEILSEINRIREKIKTYPMIYDYEKYSSHDINTVYEFFDQWHDAVKAARVKAESENAEISTDSDEVEKEIDENDSTGDSITSADSKPTEKDILDEFNRLKDIHGSYPTRSEFKCQSDYSQSDVYEHFRKWGHAMSTAKSIEYFPDSETSDVTTSGSTELEETNSSEEPANSVSAETQIVSVHVIDESGEPLQRAHIRTAQSSITDPELSDVGIGNLIIPQGTGTLSLQLEHTGRVTEKFDFTILGENQLYTIEVPEQAFETTESDSQGTPEVSGTLDTDNILDEIQSEFQNPFDSECT